VAPTVTPCETEAGGVTWTLTDGCDEDAAVVGVGVGAVVGTGSDVAGGVVAGGVVAGGVVAGGVGADVDVAVDGALVGAGPVVPPRAVVVAPGSGRLAPPLPGTAAGPAVLAAPDAVPALPATSAITPATVDVGPGTGTVPSTGACTAGPVPLDDPGPPVAGCVTSGAGSDVRAGAGATHGSRSPGRTGPPRRPTASTAT
jgi:hypothetical protein